MSREPVTIVIPVGPEPSHWRWLDEAVKSVLDQMEPDDNIVLVDDGGDYPWQGPPWALGMGDRIPGVKDLYHRCELVTLPWRMGVAGAFNAGVAEGTNKLYGSAIRGPSVDRAIMLGSDDLLLPGAIDACVQTWEDNDRADAYYWMSIEYSDDRKDKIQALPCNAAMVTRAFWRWSGGFPPETASGAPDAALISMLMVHAPEKLIAVQQGTPLTWVRVHEGQDTAGRGPWQDVIHRTRDILTKRGFEHGSIPPGS